RSRSRSRSASPSKPAHAPAPLSFTPADLATTRSPMQSPIKPSSTSATPNTHKRRRPPSPHATSSRSPTSSPTKPKRQRTSQSATSDKDADADADADEIYDRQIRLWGAAAQLRVSSARVAILGTARGLSRGLAVEAVKNLALAGIGHLSLVQLAIPNQVEEHDEDGKPTNFFAAAQRAHEHGTSAANVLEAGARALNPRVALESVRVNGGSDMRAVKDVLRGHDLVLLVDAPPSTAVAVNVVTRELGVKLLVGNVVGMNAWVFADLLAHGYIKETEMAPESKDAEPVVVRTHRKSTYVPLTEALGVELKHAVPKPRDRQRMATVTAVGMLALLRYWLDHGALPENACEEDRQRTWNAWQAECKRHGVEFDGVGQDELMHMYRGCKGEINPIAAMTGGILAQEAVKTIQQKRAPVNNLFVFVGDIASGEVVALGSKDELVGTVKDGEEEKQ
ncbi:hypothetical protein BCR44DRAFT_1443062, partial [Catenaria anguillulae PL171]